MALDDIPLEDAGRDYYARQFDGRIRDLRKGGKAPPRNSGRRATGWAAGGGVVAALIGIRIIIALVAAGSNSSSSNYNNYNNFQAPPVVVNESKPWQVEPIEPVNAPPDDQRLGEAMRRLLGREPAPTVAPDNGDNRLDKDD